MTAPENDIVVRAQGLGKRYRIYRSQFDRLRELVSPTRGRYSRDFWAVKDLDFEVKRGMVYGFIGKNGAGKSTTVKMLAGRLRPSNGSLDVRGRVSAILELGTGLQPGLTGRENARVNALFLGLDPWRTESQLQAILDFADLGEFADQPLDHYSSGMKARLAFAVLTALEPEILVLDEALATGDAAFQHKCKLFIRKLCSSGATTIVVSHDLQFMVDSCDELTWLDGGLPRAQGSPAEVVEAYLQGLKTDFRYRPRYLLLRISAPRPVPYLLQRVYFVADEGEEFGVYDVDEWADVKGNASAVGLPRALARRGWEGHVTVPGDTSLRRLQIGTREEGAVYLAVPVPQSPEPIPHLVGLVGVHDLDVALRLETLGSTGFEPLARYDHQGSRETLFDFGNDEYPAALFTLDSVWGDVLREGET